MRRFRLLALLVAAVVLSTVPREARGFTAGESFTDVYLRDDKSLNAFGRDVRKNGGVFPGNIVIGKEGTSLSGLQGLREVGGYLGIGYQVGSTYLDGNTHILSLDGLDELVDVGGNLDVDFNEHLQSLDGLEHLEAVGGLSIFDNANLPTLSGLNSLSSVQHNVWISDNSNLESLRGLDTLKHVGDDINIYNQNLLSYAALEGLANVSGVIGIYDEQDDVAIFSPEEFSMTLLDSL